MANKKMILAAIIIIASVSGFSFWYLNFENTPSFLPLGESPEIILPLYQIENLDAIQGFGQLTPDFYHNGIDFGVNATTVIVAPHNCVVTWIQFWYNDKGGHWQTNVRLKINEEWEIEVVFESWALNETYGQYQRDAIIVEVGQILNVNETIGNLLVHGDGAHIHFGLLTYGTGVCPYQHFTSEAKALFDAVFPYVNYTSSACM